MVDLRDLTQFQLMNLVKQKAGLFPLEIEQLLGRDPQPVGDFNNILTSFFTFHDWLRDRTKPQTNLKSAIAEFAIAKSEYRLAIANLLNNAIRKHETGKAVWRQMTSAKTQVEIEPGEETRSRAHERHSFRLGIPARDSHGQIIEGKTPWLTANGTWQMVSPGTGRGSSARVAFSPGLWGPKGTKKEKGPGSLPDEVLHHELVHAGREMHGLLQQYAVDASKPGAEYDNVEEFYAVVITNIYISEKAKGKETKLRNDHHGFNELKNPKQFLENTQHLLIPPVTLLEGLRKVQPNLWDALIKIGGKQALFNPVRDWEVERRKVLVDV